MFLFLVLKNHAVIKKVNDSDRGPFPFQWFLLTIFHAEREDVMDAKKTFLWT